MPMSEHISNPYHQPDLIEARARPLVRALEAAGARILASCAGHEIPWLHDLIGLNSPREWPRINFLCTVKFAGHLARMLHRCDQNGLLNYRWKLTGHHMARFDYTLGYTLTARGERAREHLLDEDISSISDCLVGCLVGSAKRGFGQVAAGSRT